MISFLSIICIFSLVAVAKTQYGGPDEHLVVEYYTTTPAQTDQFTQQDQEDANAIAESDRKEDVVASIIMYRDKTRRWAISQKILDRITGLRKFTKQKQYWIVSTHDVQVQVGDSSANTFRDLVYTLTYDENIVLTRYLENFFSKKDETWINIAMILSKDMSKMIDNYDKSHDEDEDMASRRNDQRKPFKFMLRAWVREPRATIEAGNIDPNSIMQDAEKLKKEYEDGGWHENRDQIELILMRKSIKYARLVIHEFEKLMAVNKPMEDIINDSIKDHDLNRELADTYSSLTRYIKDKYAYMAGILDKFSDGTDRWAAWLMCISVLRPEEWPKVDEVFKKAHNGDSLSKFIVQKITDNKVMAEMIALAVDSQFKPTSFAKKPVPGDPGQTPAAPPPVPPTAPAPAPP